MAIAADSVMKALPGRFWWCISLFPCLLPEQLLRPLPPEAGVARGRSVRAQMSPVLQVFGNPLHTQQLRLGLASQWSLSLECGLSFRWCRGS